jgi:hypothetical protein
LLQWASRITHCWFSRKSQIFANYKAKKSGFFITFSFQKSVCEIHDMRRNDIVFVPAFANAVHCGPAAFAIISQNKNVFAVRRAILAAAACEAR